MSDPPAPSTSNTAAQHDVPDVAPWHTAEADAIALHFDTSLHGLSQEEARHRLDRDGACPR